MTHRKVLPEEQQTLDMVGAGRNLVLVPVRFDGEERYALAARRKKDGRELLHVLALCLNLEDKGRVISAVTGEEARSVKKSRKKSLN